MRRHYGRARLVGPFLALKKISMPHTARHFAGEASEKVQTCLKNHTPGGWPKRGQTPTCSSQLQGLREVPGSLGPCFLSWKMGCGATGAVGGGHHEEV